MTKQSGEVGRHGVGVSHTQATGQRRFPRPRLPRPRLGRVLAMTGASGRARRTTRTVFARSDAGVTKQSGEVGRHGVGVSHTQATGQRRFPRPRLPRPRLGRVLAMTGASGRARRTTRTVFARSDAGVTKQSGEAGRSVRCGEYPTRWPTGNASSPTPDCHGLA